MILLVDDDVCYLRVIPHMLKTHDIESKSINQVAEAKHWLTNSEKCQTVIVNIHMRDGQGLEFLRWLEDNYAHLKIIILDNPNRDNYSALTIDHNYDKLIVPFNGEDLLSVIC